MRVNPVYMVWGSLKYEMSIQLLEIAEEHYKCQMNKCNREQAA